MLHHVTNTGSCLVVRSVFVSSRLWRGRVEGQCDNKQLLKANSGCPEDNLPVTHVFLPLLSLNVPSPIFFSFPSCTGQLSSL